MGGEIWLIMEKGETVKVKPVLKRIKTPGPKNSIIGMKSSLIKSL